MSRLEGKVALVTGSAQWIGATLARDLARESTKLVVSDIADCTQTVGAIEREGGEAIGVKADITNNGELGDLVRLSETRRYVAPPIRLAPRRTAENTTSPSLVMLVAR